METKKKVFLLEDSPWDAENFERHLLDIDDFELIGRRTNIAEAIQFCKETPPDLVVVDGDINEDKAAGANFVKQLAVELPQVRTMGFTRYKASFDMLIEAGCDHFTMKDFVSDSKGLQFHLRQTMDVERGADSNPSINLSTKEFDVLLGIATGKTGTEIIESTSEIRTTSEFNRIRKSLFIKFGVDKSAQLVHEAHKAKILL